VSFAWSVPAGNRYYTTVQYLNDAGATIGRTGLMINGVAPAPLVAPASTIDRQTSVLVKASK